jgi:hypothetical protein
VLSATGARLGVVSESIEWPPESAYAAWAAEERERYVEGCLSRGDAVTDEGWNLHLRVMSFNYLEKAVHLACVALDPTGDSIEAHNAAVDSILADVERMRLDPTDAEDVGA